MKSVKEGNISSHFNLVSILSFLVSIRLYFEESFRDDANSCLIISP